MYRVRIDISAIIFFCFLTPLLFAQSPENLQIGKIVVRNLGPIINSPEEDHSPFLSHDDLILFFTSRRPVPDGYIQGDKFWSAKRTDNSANWQNPAYLAGLNNFKACGSICFDTSKRAYIAASEVDDVDIWEVSIPGGGKLYAHPLPSPVSTAAWESAPTVTVDGNTIVFASNRKNSKGTRGKNIDLFISHRSTDGHWSEACNLGPTINTDATEGTPCISPDGQFLFFCSSSDSTARDIYFSKHTGTSDTSWSKPVRLPEYINSQNQDMCPIITNGGTKILFASNRVGGYGGLDIYEADLPIEIQDAIKPSFTLH